MAKLWNPLLVSLGSRRNAVLLTAMFAVLGCWTIGWMVRDDGHSAVSSASPSPNPVQARTTPVPDPRFVPPPVIRIPGANTPEAQQAIAEMVARFRCYHTGASPTLPVPSADGSTTLEQLAAEYRQRLAVFPDACFVNNAFPQVANPRTPAALMNVLYENLGKRSDAIRLPAFLVIASIQNHPMAANALENLRSITNQDFQQDWPCWERAISETLTRGQHGARGISCRVH